MHFFALVQLNRRLASYGLLAAELHKRFTPVHLQVYFMIGNKNLENW